jgi:tRNA-2-methylthio-N6-dimethylallyladenosine synthase
MLIQADHPGRAGLEKKHFYIHTFGCQMNVQDSDKMAFLLSQSGYEITQNPLEADLILLNTCSIREKAAQKVFSQLGRYRSLKEENPALLIGVGGCLAQQWGERIFQRAPFVDLVFGTHQIQRLPELVDTLRRRGGRLVERGFCDHVNSLDIGAKPPGGAVCTFVTIMQGCNNFCAYCVVPFVRGPEKSRSLAGIVGEIQGLAEQGIREVTLLGQNVNSYGSPQNGGADFTDLIRAIDGVSGIERIRFTTSHPKDLSPKLIESFGQVPSLCEHIHLPIQSGSDRILARMNRGYTAAQYLAKVSDLRRVCPGISITSDIIVGFPGEEEADFEATLELMRQVQFDNLFSFQYSEREGTSAVGMDGIVGADRKGERLQRLQALQSEHTLQRNRAYIGCREAVLVEGISKNGGGEVTGRTRTNRIVNFTGERDLVGQTVAVRITEAFRHSLHGVIDQKGGAACSLK